VIDRHIIRGVKVWDNRTKHAVEIDVDVMIHIGELARRMGDKAYNNRSRKSRALDGAVEVGVRGAKATPVRERETA
jgi:hypothetical protein